MDLLLIVIVSLIILSGLDAHLWPQHATERRLFVSKLTEAERARRRHVALVPAADALELLEYVSALERDGNGWRSVAGVRQERIVELERNGVVGDNEV